LREVESVWQDASGAEIPVGVSASRLRNRWGELMGGVLVVRDLRETKRRIAELQAATTAARARAEELQKANADLERLQDELIQAAKMSSLGRLAAGVAHELNNPLGGITLYADLLAEDMPAEDPRRRTVEKIAAQTTRCRKIVRALLDFARPATSAARPVDVNIVLRETMNILEGQQMFHNVEVRRDFAGRLPLIQGDPDQLRQAFVNLVLNAVEAMGGRGVLSLASRMAEDGQGVVVSVGDTGCGIATEHMERLFEPFFTTKEGGTGLGLPITYGIVKRHNGTIEVRSEVGKGTTFKVLLHSMAEGGDDGR
jgi:signal transduction histidine kinase